MSWTIRRLTQTDEPLYRTAYSWLANGPSWRRETEEIFNGPLTWERYWDATSSPGRCDVGIFDQSRLIAIVILTLTGKATYEVHLEASKSANYKVVIAASTAIRAFLFGQYQARLAYLWLPRFNRSVIRIISAIGFQPTGVSMWRGTCRGRLVEWQHYSLAVEGQNGR